MTDIMLLRRINEEKGKWRGGVTLHPIKGNRKGENYYALPMCETEKGKSF
jgi:hypothetical protein